MRKSVTLVLVIFVILLSSPFGLNCLCFAQPHRVVATIPVEPDASALVYNSTNNNIYAENRGSLIVDEITMALAHSLSDRRVNLQSSDSTIKNVKSKNKIIMYRDKIPIEVDYDKGVLIVQGKEIPIIVDGDVKITDPRGEDWVDLSYDRFEVHIEPGYYANNTEELNLFFDRFEPRYELMENLTDWSTEEYYPSEGKLDIYVEEYGNCWWGYAFGGEAHLFLYEDLSNPNVCKFPYYENGSPVENPGELGDHWWYMTGALHEALHAINPFPVYARGWLTEGWSHYYQYNILSSYYGNSYPDINQETADYYNYHGTPNYNWADYVANDYHDTSPYNATIQESAGYDITAWMFSMLRDDYLLPWEDFYSIIDNNSETLDESMSLGDYYTDTHIIDVFERATGVEMEPVFRYDGPDGPGWGVRQWESLGWYADLVPELEASDTTPVPGDSIWLNATIYNNGDVGLNDVVVRFYSNDSLINEQTTGVDSNGFVIVSTQYSAPEGDYDIRLAVDEDNLKIEKDDSNNQDSVLVSFVPLRGDASGDGAIDVADVMCLINYLFIGGSAPDPLWVGDCNCDESVDVADVMYLINYLFIGGSPPGC